MLLKAARMDMVPVMIARKFAYPTRYLFQNIGALGFETHFQYFAPHLKEDMQEIIHKNGLGFHATRFSVEEEDRIIKFFEKTLYRQIENLNNTFLSIKDDIIYFGEILADEDLPNYKRKEVYKEAFKTFVRPEWEEKEKENYYPPGYGEKF